MNTVYEKLVVLSNYYSIEKKGNSIFIRNKDRNTPITSFYDDVSSILKKDLPDMKYEIKTIIFISPDPIFKIFNDVGENIGIIIMDYFTVDSIFGI
jgi:hypothetical protein